MAAILQIGMQISLDDINKYYPGYQLIRNMGQCWSDQNANKYQQKGEPTDKNQIIVSITPSNHRIYPNLALNQHKQQSHLSGRTSNELVNLESEFSKRKRSKKIFEKNTGMGDSTTLLSIKIKLLNGTVHEASVSSNTTVSQLKTIINQKYSQLLLPDQMVLQYNTKKLETSQHLSQIIATTNKRNMQFIQRKAQIWQIEWLQADINQVDEVSGEKGVAIMICNHYFSRETMIGTINYQVDVQKRWELKCPSLNSEGFICDEVWDKTVCRYVAGFNKDEMADVQNKLTQNWKKAFSKQCPSCKSQVSNVGLQVKKVECPNCGLNFCYQCRETWQWQDDKICQSDVCDCSRKLITDAPWTRVFMMYRIPETETYFEVKVPDIRACPRCFNLIKNVNNCKHTGCICTTDQQYSFCFVCLNLAPKNGERWACGGGYQYCERVAPNQTLENLRGGLN